MIFGQPMVIKPADGWRIRKPGGQFLADTGETVIASHYWQRRMDAGDVVEYATEGVDDAATPISPKKTRG